MVFVGAAAAARCVKGAVVSAQTKGEISGAVARAEPTAAVARVRFAELAEGGLVDVPGAARGVATGVARGLTLGKCGGGDATTVLAVMRVADGGASSDAVSSDADMLVLFVDDHPDDHPNDDADGGDGASARTKDGSLRLDTRLHAPAGRLEMLKTAFGFKKHLLTAGDVDITAVQVEGNEGEDEGECVLYRIVPKANSWVPRRKVLIGGAAKVFEVEVCGEDAGAQALREWLRERSAV